MLASSAIKQQTSETAVVPQKPLPVILPPLPRRVVEESQEPDLKKEKGWFQETCKRIREETPISSLRQKRTKAV